MDILPLHKNEYALSDSGTHISQSAVLPSTSPSFPTRVRLISTSSDRLAPRALCQTTRTSPQTTLRHSSTRTWHGHLDMRMGREWQGSLQRM